MNRIVRRAAGTPLSEAERSELRALALKPDAEIDFSDIPERVYPEPSRELPFEARTLTLRLDPEVAEWLETAGDEDVRQINILLKRAAHRRMSAKLPVHSLLDKAS